jgi:hypothetical protein
MQSTYTTTRSPLTACVRPDLKAGNGWQPDPHHDVPGKSPRVSV